MTKRDWGRNADRQRIARQGAETVDGGDVPIGAPRPRKSKADLRAEAEAALSVSMRLITRIIKCQCGRKVALRIPANRLRSPLRCVSCGRIAT